jgi:hypothetical protein
MPRCEFCNKPFNPWLPRSQRFCGRACADQFYADERKDALHWYRAWLAAGKPSEDEIAMVESVELEERRANAEQART